MALKDSILTRIAVDDDKSKVETVNPFDGEVASVHRTMRAIVGQPIPALAVYHYLIDIVFIVVQMLIDLTPTVDGDVVFAREASHY